MPAPLPAPLAAPVPAAWPDLGRRVAPALPDALPRFGDRRRMRVGLLGGSFNPAHGGHAHIAQLALRRLRLDQVWLLVSPGNPLKPAAGMAPLAQRLHSARRIADGRRVIATSIEASLGTRYTADTLRVLRRRFAQVRFVWLMGADNLSQLPRWRRWQQIAQHCPVAVLPRPGYNLRARAGQAAKRLRHGLHPDHHAACLAGFAPPAWVFLIARQDGRSATALRAAQQGDALSPASQPRPQARVENPARPAAPPAAARSRRASPSPRRQR